MASEFSDIISQLGVPIWLLAIAIIWTAVWKGLALWKAARKNSPVWFILLLVINTLGIFEILYIFLFSEINLNGNKKRSRRSK